MSANLWQKPLTTSNNSLSGFSGLVNPLQQWLIENLLWPEAVIGLPQPELVKWNNTLAPLIIVLISNPSSHLKPCKWWSEQEEKQTLFYQLVWQRVTHSKEWISCQRPFVPWVNEVFPIVWADISQVDCLWSSKYCPFPPHLPVFCTEMVKELDNKAFHAKVKLNFLSRNVYSLPLSTPFFSAACIPHYL